MIIQVETSSKEINECHVAKTLRYSHLSCNDFCGSHGKPMLSLCSVPVEMHIVHSVNVILEVVKISWREHAAIAAATAMTTSTTNVFCCAASTSRVSVCF